MPFTSCLLCASEKSISILCIPCCIRWWIRWWNLESDFILAFSSTRWISTISSVILWISSRCPSFCAPAPQQSQWPYTRLTALHQNILHKWTQNNIVFQNCHKNTDCWEITIFFVLLSGLFLINSYLLLAFITARACYWQVQLLPSGTQSLLT